MHNASTVNTNTSEWRSSVSRANASINIATYALLALTVVICFALPAQLIRNAAGGSSSTGAGQAQTTPGDLRGTSAHVTSGAEGIQDR